MGTVSSRFRKTVYVPVQTGTYSPPPLVDETKVSREDTLRTMTDEELDTVPPLFASPQTVAARVVKVYDGDTVHVVCYFRDSLTRIKLRLGGVDTPEIRVAEQKAAGLAVQKAVRTALMSTNELVLVTIGKRTKYGDPQAAIRTKSIGDIATWLLRNNMANPYDGSTKLGWTAEALENAAQCAAAVFAGT